MQLLVCYPIGTISLVDHDQISTNNLLILKLSWCCSSFYFNGGFYLIRNRCVLDFLLCFGVQRGWNALLNYINYAIREISPWILIRSRALFNTLGSHDILQNYQVNQELHSIFKTCAYGDSQGCWVLPPVIRDSQKVFWEKKCVEMDFLGRILRGRIKSKNNHTNFESPDASMQKRDDLHLTSTYFFAQDNPCYWHNAMKSRFHHRKNAIIYIWGTFLTSNWS